MALKIPIHHYNLIHQFSQVFVLLSSSNLFEHRVVGCDDLWRNQAGGEDLIVLADSCKSCENDMIYFPDHRLILDVVSFDFLACLETEYDLLERFFESIGCEVESIVEEILSKVFIFIENVEEKVIRVLFFIFELVNHGFEPAPPGVSVRETEENFDIEALLESVIHLRESIRSSE